MSSNVWDDITYPLPNFHDAAVEVWELDLGLKFIHVSKRDQWNASATLYFYQLPLLLTRLNFNPSMDK